MSLGSPPRVSRRRRVGSQPWLAALGIAMALCVSPCRAAGAVSAVLVVFERDGQPLADREGRIALVSGRDLRTGPRSVRWLTRIDVRVLKD